MWPTDACTTKSGPRYLLIVLAFAGLSTMTSWRPVPLLAGAGVSSLTGFARGAFFLAAGCLSLAAFLLAFFFFFFVGLAAEVFFFEGVAMGSRNCGCRSSRK